MSSPPPSVQYVTVICGVCGTRVDERLTDRSREVRCPDCHQPVRIPARDELPVAPPSPTPADPGVYGLRVEDNIIAGAGSRPKRARKDVLVICPVCNARLHPPLREKRYRVRCPDCHEPVLVPSPEEAAAREERDRPPPVKLAETDTLPIPTPRERRPLSTFYSLQTVQIRREAPQPPPKWVWFSGVWDFPWTREVLKKWGFISLGCTLLGGLVAMLVGLIGGVSTPASAVMAFFALPMVWVFLWTASYASATCLTVITETAAGNQRIGDWPDQGWREGMFAFLPLVYLTAVAALLGHVAGLAASAGGLEYWPTLFAALGLLGPYLLLSMLETGGWYLPFSGPVTRSLWRNWYDWGMAYLLLGGLLAGWGWLWLRALAWSPILTVLTTGGIWAAVVLIAARLLGRLAWRITQPRAGDE